LDIFDSNIRTILIFAHRETDFNKNLRTIRFFAHFSLTAVWCRFYLSVVIYVGHQAQPGAKYYFVAQYHSTKFNYHPKNASYSSY